jgi:hypothetical protein
MTYEPFRNTAEPIVDKREPLALEPEPGRRMEREPVLEDRKSPAPSGHGRFRPGFPMPTEDTHKEAPRPGGLGQVGADFFKQIDQQIGRKQQDDQAAERDRRATAESSRTFIAQVKPMLEGYAAELKQRKIEAKVDHRGDSLSFELHFRSGGYHGFTLSAGKINTDTTEKGRRFSFDERDIPNGIDLKIFEKFVQETIAEFMRKAPQDGGFQAY